MRNVCSLLSVSLFHSRTMSCLLSLFFSLFFLEAIAKNVANSSVLQIGDMIDVYYATPILVSQHTKELCYLEYFGYVDRTKRKRRSDASPILFISYVHTHTIKRMRRSKICAHNVQMNMCF